MRSLVAIIKDMVSKGRKGSSFPAQIEAGNSFLVNKGTRHDWVASDSDDHYRSLVERIPIGITRTTPGPEGRFIMVNPAFVNMLGFENEEEVYQMRVSDIYIDPKEREKFSNELLNKGSLSGVQLQLKRKDGTPFAALLTAKVVSPNTNKSEIYFDCVVEDISGRHTAEEKRIAQLETIRQTSLSLTASLNLQDVLYTIVKCALDLIPGANNCHIFLYTPENGGRLEFGAALWSDGRYGEPFAIPRPHGLTFTVARSGETIVVPDMANHPLFADAPPSWKGAIIGLPLKIGQRVVGVMNMSHSRSAAFSEEDIHILRLLGDQAAIAIENARLYAQVETERRHLSLLYNIGRQLALCRDEMDILRKSISLTCQALGGNLGMAFTFEEGRNRLKLVSFYNGSTVKLKEPSRAVYAQLDDNLPGWIAQIKKPLGVNDLTEEPRWSPLIAQEKELHSLLGAPILFDDKLLGVLTVQHRKPGAFSPDHLELLEAICSQVGLALSNVKRYDQVQHLADLLAREQERLENLIEKLPVGVILLDKTYRPMVINSLGREILTSFNPQKDPESFTDLQNENLSPSRYHLGPYTFEDLVRRSNEPLPIEIALGETIPRVFEAEARPIGAQQASWVLMLREVTQERQNQTRIQMQERLATVGQLAAGIAHDFNNIMATILVYTDLMNKECAADSSAMERLSIIRQQVQRAASLIRQILDFSRRSVMEPSALDLLPFIKEVDKLLVRVLPETIKVELTYQPGHYMVSADPARLQQVIMNLALNARDAMPDGGTLRIDLDHFELNQRDIPPTPYLPHGKWITLAVSDTGIGIPPEILPHIFEPFFTTKPVGQGTGLGLAQAYGIVKQHDGYIDVQSQPGRGARFVIYLPALPLEEQPEESTQIDELPNGNGRCVLVVEDDPATREAIRALLEAQNFSVITASNGLEAIDTFEAQPESVSMIISDIVMPEMGGVVMFEELKNRWPGTKILFVTGHPLEEDNILALEKSSIPWIQKPFSVPEFFQKVNAILAEGGHPD